MQLCVKDSLQIEVSADAAAHVVLLEAYGNDIAACEPQAKEGVR
jgi:hypothetical protein